MQKTNKDINNKIKKKKTFWQRQFQKEATDSQKNFDLVFGIFMPVICFMFDPAIFKAGDLWAAPAVFGKFKPFAYLLCSLSIMSLMAFLIWGKNLKGVNVFLSGLFIIGGLVSLAVGIVMIPISLLGLIILIGILGFTPFLTALVYIRNSVRAFKFAKPLTDWKLAAQAFVLTASLSLIAPILINKKIENAKQEILIGDAQTVRKEAEFLYWVSPITNFDSLFIEFRSLNVGDEKREALKEVYRNFTGEDIEEYRHWHID